jgi:putative transposase
MARLPRLTIAHYPHHLLQRGNNREAICKDRADYDILLTLLHTQAQRCEVAIHAYVLMDNHFHLLATPHSDTGLPTLMQAVGRSYVRYFNQRYQRSGTLWEGRYRCTVVQPERYLLACMAYIDLNPVRRALVGRRYRATTTWGCVTTPLPPYAVLGPRQYAVCPASGLRRPSAKRPHAAGAAPDQPIGPLRLGVGR